MKIGSIKLDHMTVFAPLAGITNLPMRVIAKEEGCGLVCSEMISAKGLVYNAAKTVKMLDISPMERPVSVQIFGSEPAVMADAAARVEASGADIIDINFGCSVRKVIKTGSGAALMKDLFLSEEILKAVRKSVRIPFTIKIRSGWDNTGDQAVHLSRIAQDQGVDAITIHPRTAKQGFKGRADWSLITRVKQHVKIPVIGNGDILCPEDALRMKKETGCDAVMIGRAAIGNPWIFSGISALIAGNEIPTIKTSMRFKTMKKYLDESVAFLGEKQACFLMRGRLGWFVKGLPHSSKFRESIKRVSSKEETMKLIHSYRQLLKEKETNKFS